jgi:protein TonB
LGSSSADVAPGSDQGGARALFAPPPNIPDDLRDEPLEAVAIAHFVVGADGSVQVSLVQPTENARLNEVLLEALKLWRFAPAMKNGIAIASAFDVRIPISIQ